MLAVSESGICCNLKVVHFISKLLLKNGPLIFMLLNIISLYLEAIRSDYFYEVCHLII